MSPDQRKKYLLKVQSLAVGEGCRTEVRPELSPSKDATEGLSIEVGHAAQQLNIPQNLLEGIRVKAKQLIDTEGAIVNAPGQPLEPRSYGRKTPHMVTPQKGGNFSCDSSCPNWKSFGICSYSIAVAEVNGQQFMAANKKTM